MLIRIDIELLTQTYRKIRSANNDLDSINARLSVMWSVLVASWIGNSQMSVEPMWLKARADFVKLLEESERLSSSLQHRAEEFENADNHIPYAISSYPVVAKTSLSTEENIHGIN